MTSSGEVRMFKKLGKKLLGTNDNIKYYAINGILFTIVSVLSRSYAIKFLDRLGGNAFHFSLFNALPGFVAIFTTLPGMLMIQRAKSKRKMLSIFFYISRFFPLLLAAVPFLPKAVQPAVFVVIYGLMNFPESISATSLQDYSGDVFTPSERADAITLRNQLSQMSQITVSILVGFVLSLSTDNAVVIRLYQVFILMSFLVGLKEILYIRRMRPAVQIELPQEKHETKILASIRECFADKEYVRFLTASLIFHFGWQMGWPLFNLYTISYLHANEMWLTIINVVSSLVMVISFNFWRRLIKKRSFALAISFATLGMSLTPVLYALSRTLFQNTLMQLATGFFTAGTITVILGSLLESSPAKNRTISIALHATLTSVTLAISPLIGNAIHSRYSIQVALLVTAGFRLLGFLAFIVRYLTRKKN